MAPISAKQLHACYNLERVVFYRLIMKLGRNVAQSLLVMALWLWLEKIGYPCVILVVDGLSDPLVNAMFNEADACIKSLKPENVPIPNGGGLPLTRIAMRMEISLELFIRRRFTAIAGIKSILDTTCARIFTDILREKIDSTNASNRTCARASTGSRTNVIACASASINARASTSARSSASIPVTPLVVPGFPHPLFGNFTTPPNNFEEMDLFDPRMWTITGPHDDVPDDDKTMFLTFSRGYPVREDEVRYLFTTLFGDCIKVLNMKKTRAQVMFATMVLNRLEQLDLILNGKYIAKFRVNRKHIWARKYGRRD